MRFQKYPDTCGRGQNFIKKLNFIAGEQNVVNFCLTKQSLLLFDRNCRYES